MSKGSSAPPQVGTQTITTNNSPTPWTPQQPFLQAAYAQAQNLDTNDPISPYPGQTLADVAPQQAQALNDATNFAQNDPTTANATSLSNSILNGSQLSAGNPYFSNMVNQIAQTTQPSVDSQFEGAGRYGSGADANAFASNLLNQTGNLAYQNFNNGQQNQIKALNVAPQTQGLASTDASNLYNAGAQTRNLGQDYINEDMTRFAQSQQDPWSTLQNYIQGIALPAGTATSGTSNQPIFGQPASQQLTSNLTSAALISNALFNSGNNGNNAGLLSNLFNGSGSSGG